MSDRVSGGCLCGQVSYSFDRSQVISAHHCHCTDCQKSTGSGKATIVLVPTTAFDLEGECKTYTVTGTDGSHVTRGFCDNCGSPLVSFIEENPALRIVKEGCIFDSSWIEISSSFWSDSAVAWSPVDEEHPLIPKNPNTA